jgi:REP element-mobilizing transposase RayT
MSWSNSDESSQRRTQQRNNHQENKIVSVTIHVEYSNCDIDMANTYSQIHIQLVFAVKLRRGVILKSWRQDLFKYMTGIVQSRGHKLLCINGVEDHVHLLIGLRPTQAVSMLVQEIKRGSATWINDNRLVAGKFSWQEGFGVFSYSPKALDNVIQYIQNQEEHHRKRSFIDEFAAMLKEFNIEFDSRYTFKDLEE